MKIELGGGGKPREGFLNLDQCETADIRLDLENAALPFADDSVEEVYSSHFFEHLSDPTHLLHEIVRVCRLGAKVEIRVPAYLSQMAMTVGHRYVLSPLLVQHWCVDFVRAWWRGCKKRLSLDATVYRPSQYFREAKDLFNYMTDEQVMRFIPGACHDIAFVFSVIPYDGGPGEAEQ